MSMLTWAEKEVEIACARERAASGSEEGEFDYGCACYRSALKAFKSLMEDGHSGMSISLTKHILVRLIDGDALTPIEDTPDVWYERCSFEDEVVESYQCSRMSSLFKDVYKDGTVKYSDVSRVYCVDKDNPDLTYTNGMVTNLINELYPITMPYIPGERFKVTCEDFLVDPKNGDFDTKGILYLNRKDGTREPINKYYKETDTGFVEIDISEYYERKHIAMTRKKEE